MKFRRSEAEQHHLNPAGLQGPLELPQHAVLCCYPIAGTLHRAQCVAFFITPVTVDCTAAISRGNRCARSQGECNLKHLSLVVLVSQRFPKHTFFVTMPPLKARVTDGGVPTRLAGF